MRSVDDNIGSMIRRLRMALGLSQRELARLAGVSQSLIARIESGSINPRYETVRRILAALEEAERRRKKAESIASKPVVTVNRNDPLRRALELMDKHGFSQLPVVDEQGRVVGTVYEGTILRVLLAQGRSALEKPVEEFMEEPLPVLKADEDVSKVVELLYNHPAVIVGDEEGRPLGIITRTDVVRSIASGGLQWNQRGV